MALFDYIDRYPDGFRILVRDTPVVRDPEAPSVIVGGTFAGLLVDVAARVDDLLASQFKAHKLNPKWAPLYSQMLVGMVAQTGQWWLDVRKPKKEEVVAHLVNLAWNGLQNLEVKPAARPLASSLTPPRDRRRDSRPRVSRPQGILTSRILT